MTDAKEKKLRKLLYTLSDRVLAFLGLFFVTSALFVSLLYSANLRLPISLEIFVYLCLMFAGYFLQSLWCLFIGFRRPDSTISYESLEKSYSFKRTIPVVALAIALGFAVKPYVQQRLIHLSQTEQYYYYDEDSFIPYLAIIFIVGAIVSGSLTWFLHSEQILTGRGVIVSLIVMAFSIVFTVNIGQAAVVFQSVCVVGFTCCWMFAMNRQAIRKTLASDKAPHPGANVVSYNTSVTALLLVAALLLLGLFYIIISGIYSMVMLGLAILLSAGKGQDGWSEEQPEFVSGIYQGVFGTVDARESPDYWFMILTIILLTIGLIMFLSRRTRTVQQLLAAIAEFLRSIIAALLGPMQDFFSKDTIVTNEFAFLDEEEKLSQNAMIRAGEVRAARTWFDFWSEYHAKKTPEDRYRFAYAEYAAILRKNHGMLKISDTPRETGDKLRKLTDNAETKDEIEAFTGAFERADFACLPADAGTEAATKILLREIKHYLK